MISVIAVYIDKKKKDIPVTVRNKVFDEFVNCFISDSYIYGCSFLQNTSEFLTFVSKLSKNVM